MRSGLWVVAATSAPSAVVRLDDAVARGPRARSGGTAASAARPPRRGPAGRERRSPMPSSGPAPPPAPSSGGHPSGRRIRNEAPPSSRCLRGDGTAVRLDDAAADRAGRGRRRRLPRCGSPPELLEHARLAARRQAGPAVGDLDLERVLAPARAPDLDRAAGGRVLERVVEQVHEDLLEEHRVDGDERQVRRAGPATTRRGPRAWPRGAPAPSPRSPRGAPTRASARARPTRAASCRGGSPTSRSIRSASVQIVSRSSARCAWRQAGRSSSRRAVPAPVIAASGVRRSWDTALEQRAAHLLRPARAAPRLRPPRLEPRALDGERRLPHERIEEGLRCSTVEHVARVAAQEASTPSVVAPDAERHAGHPRSPAGCPCPGRPAGRARRPSAATARAPRSPSARFGRGSTPRAPARPVGSRSRTAASPPKTSAACLAVTCAGLLRRRARRRAPGSGSRGRPSAARAPGRPAPAGGCARSGR